MPEVMTDLLYEAHISSSPAKKTSFVMIFIHTGLHGAMRGADILFTIGNYSVLSTWLPRPVGDACILMCLVLTWKTYKISCLNLLLHFLKSLYYNMNTIPLDSHDQDKAFSALIIFLILQICQYIKLLCLISWKYMTPSFRLDFPDRILSMHETNHPH